MKKFVFRLENLLKYRRRALQTTERKLAIQSQKYNAVMESIAQCEYKKERTYMIYGTEKSPIEDLRQAEIYRQGLQQRIDLHKKDLIVLEKARSEAQSEYLQQKKYYRALEILKEKELNGYKVKKNRYTEKVLDDVLLAQKYAENL